MKKQLVIIFSGLILLTIVSCGKPVEDPTGEIATQIQEDERTPEEVTEVLEAKEVEEGSEQAATALERLLNTYEKQDSKLSRCEDTISLKEFIYYGPQIEKLDGEIIDPTDFKYDLIGFQKFLSQSGVKHFSAYEMTKPGNKKHAKDCSLQILLPPKGCWLRSAAIALFADKVRGDIKNPVVLTSHWRNSCYNKKVGGVRNSDHIESRAADLSFQTPSNRKKAQTYICNTFWKEDLFNLGVENESDLNISIGLGNKFMHVGLGSKNGRRHWVYKSFVENNKLPKECWSKSL